MAWYYIVLIVIGAIIALLVVKVLVYVILDMFKVDEDVSDWITLPVLKLLETIKNAHLDKEYEREIQEEQRNDSENKYIDPSYFRTHPVFPIDKGSSQLAHSVIYCEWDYHEPVNRYIAANYDRIVKTLANEGLDFIYAPKFLANLQASVSYSYPDAVDVNVKPMSPADFYKCITENIVAVPSHNPMLFIPDPDNDAGYPAEELGDNLMSNYRYELNYLSDTQLDYIFNKHLQQILRQHIVRYRLAEGIGEDFADSQSIGQLADEIQSRIKQLYIMGVSESVISRIVALPEPKLSKLLITDDYRIFLPDYNNMEITMPALSKALYFFYLRHPEGIMFKELRDHKAELSEIYRTISPREDMDRIEKSIEDIVDSTKNSVNEKCSRIKAAFVSQFNDNLANNYYITGIAGEPKKITLNRLLVDDNSRLICLK